MLLVSISFIINTSIFSFSLFIVFHLIKGHIAIFNNLHFYTWKRKKKKNYKKKGFYQLDQSSLAFFLFLFLFSALVTFRFFMEIIYASNYKIYIKSSRSNITYMKLGGPYHILFCVCVNCYDPTCMCILRGCNYLCLQKRERFFLIQQLLLWRRRRHFKEKK